MTTPITYAVKLDTGKDGLFNDSIDDISAYVVNFDTSSGMNVPYQEIADSCSATLILDNDSKVFTPEVTGSELVSNGSFATWSGGNPSSWTVTGESGSNPEVSQVSPSLGHGGGGSGAANLYSTSSVVSIAQSILTIGTTYKVVFNVTKATAGAIVIKNNTTTIFGPIRKPGKYEFKFNATHASFKIESSRYTCDITIDNVSVKAMNKYALMEAGMLVKIIATLSGGGTSTLFLAKIADPINYGIDPMSGQLQGRSVTITLEDPTTDLQRADYFPELLFGVSTFDVIKDVIDSGVVQYPQDTRYCILDAQGYCELDNVSIFSNEDLRSGDDGVTVHEFVGDMADRGQGVSAYGVIKDAVEAECGGRFFWQPRTGAWVFQSRHHDILNTTIAATLTGSSITGLQYSYSKYRKNRVTLTYNLQKVGTPESVVWTMQGLPLELQNNSSKTLTAKYKDPDNEQARIGAMDYVLPFAGTDFVANSNEDGSGTDVSTRVSVTAEFKATSAKITYYNNSGATLYLQSAQLRATPLTLTPEVFEIQDADSIAMNGGVREFPVEVRFISDRNLAEDYARSLVGKFKNSLPQFEGIRFNAYENSTTKAAAMGYTVGDKITITESYTGHSATYVIVGERHSVNAGQGSHWVSYTLKPDGRERWCVLNQTGRDELDDVLIGF